MKTRPLTKREREQIDAAWNEYLDIACDCASFDQIFKADAQYHSVLNDLNVISTLAGYRVREGTHLDQI